MPDHLTPAAEALGPTTRAGWALLGREALNSRSFTLISAADILAIESEARATADARIAALTAEVEGLRTVVDEARLVGQWYDADLPRVLRAELRDLYQHARAALTPPDSPALRAALDLGLAWKRAEAALPAGWVLKELRLHDDVSGWGAEAFNTTGVGRYRHMGYGPTPTAALTALAEALEARQQGHEVTTR